MPEVILEQACLLARRVGPSQKAGLTDAPAGMTSHPDLWLSLYTRDKAVSLFQGKSCCLPGLDWPQPGSIQPHTVAAARLELAELQERIFTHLYSDESSRETPQKRGEHMLSLKNALDLWAKAHASVLSDDACSSANIRPLFHSTRILVLRLSSDSGLERELLEDARAACQLLATAGANTGAQSSIMYTLVENFSPAAFFSLATHVIRGSTSSTIKDDLQNDISLLRSTAAGLAEISRRTHLNSYSQRLSRVLDSALAVVISFSGNSISGHPTQPSALADAISLPFASKSAHHAQGQFPVDFHGMCDFSISDLEWPDEGGVDSLSTTCVSPTSRSNTDTLHH